MILPPIAHLITSGQIAPAIMALTLLEICAIAAYRRRFGGGISLAECVPNILAGDFLLLAWALSATHWLCSAASLACALLAHATDTLHRWRAPEKKLSGSF